MQSSISCPWSDFAPGTIAFCEERLCAWIVEPANAWSNIAYLAVGAYVCWRAIRGGERLLLPIGVSGLLVGFGSFAFHATGPFWGEALDISAMFLISGLFLTFALKRLLGWGLRLLLTAYLGILLLSVGLLLLVRPSGIPIFSLHLIIWLALEVRLYRARRRPIDYSALRLMLIFFAASFLSWVVDITGLLCDPENHWISGHAIWHLLNANCFFFFYRYQQQFLGSAHERG